MGDGLLGLATIAIVLGSAGLVEAWIPSEEWAKSLHLTEATCGGVGGSWVGATPGYCTMRTHNAAHHDLVLFLYSVFLSLSLSLPLPLPLPPSVSRSLPWSQAFPHAFTTVRQLCGFSAPLTNAWG